MKKTIAILCFLALSLSAMAGKNVSKTQLAALVSEYRQYDGVELVQLGSLATSALKTVIRISAKDDPDAAEALQLLGGIRRLTVFEYEDCSPAVKERITRKLNRILDSSELLIEAKDGDDAMRMYGVVDEKGDSVRDFVLHTPGSCALICIFGKVSMKTISKIMEEND
jgi:hypothetical protein